MCYAFRWARNRLHAHNEFRQAYTVCRSTHYRRVGYVSRVRWIADDPSIRVDFYVLVKYL